MLAMDSCAWCRRLDDHPLGAGEICAVCLGLCSFAFCKVEAATSLYRPAFAWVEQAFAFHYAERLSREREQCWWCARPGYDTAHTSRSADLFYVAPTLCLVCDGLFIPELPAPPERLKRVAQSYDYLCEAIAA